MSEDTELPSSLVEALAAKKVFSADGQSHALHSNVSLEEAVGLYRIVRKLNPERGVEVGFAQGVSAQAILKAMEDNGRGTHHVIDPFQAEFHDCGLEMVKRAGLSHRLTFYRKFAEEVIPSLPEVDFSFIDASHLFDLSLVEFVLSDKKLRIGGIVAFHDMWMPSQQALVRYILNNRSYEIVEFGGGDPCAVVTDKWALIRKICRIMLGNRAIFRESFLAPWKSMNIGNLVALRKVGNDSRDWRFHADF